MQDNKLNTNAWINITHNSNTSANVTRTSTWPVIIDHKKVCPKCLQYFTGVGALIARGSQLDIGNCALLVIATTHIMPPTQLDPETNPKPPANDNTT